MQDPYSPGTRDPNTGWSVDQASGFTPPGGVGTHGHTQAQIEGLVATIAALQESVAVGVPVGVIQAYYGASAPTGWLLCDGAAIPAQYTALIALVGANTPNLKGKVIVGVDGADGDFSPLGDTGGAKTVALSTAQVGSHAHGLNNHSHGGLTATRSQDHTHSGTTGSQNNNHHHDISVDNNLGPDVFLTPGANAYALGAHTVSTTNQNNDHTHGFTSGGSSLNHTHNVSGDTSNTTTTAAASAHSNLQPFMAIPYIIKAG